MINTKDILETIAMIQDENLDIRTVTMGISLLDCIDSNIDVACERVFEKITRYAEQLVPVCEKIETKYGIPIINKRIAVTPIAMLLAACPTGDPVKFAHTLERLQCFGAKGFRSRRQGTYCEHSPRPCRD